MSTPSIFTKIAETPRKDLTEVEERIMITTARKGDNIAATQLLANYLPLLKSIVGTRYRDASQVNTAQRTSTLLEDLQSAAISGFFDALRDFDSAVAFRLGGLLKVCVRRALYDESAAVDVVTVPSTMRDRFRAVLQAADGDRAKARLLAPTLGMSTDSYDAIARVYQLGTAPALLSGNSSDGDDFAYAEPLSESPLVHVEDVAMAGLALSALDPTERLVIEALYGIGGEVQTERDAAAALDIPRTTLQRTHKRALTKMHSKIA